MQYIKVMWKHDFEDEPIEIYSELDDVRMETRKIELYKNGSIGFADISKSVNNTHLSKLPLPTLSEISSDIQFVPQEISKELFEKLWANLATKKI